MVDEVYHGIHFGPVDAQPAAGDGPHVVSIGDVAKPYGLDGLRIGWIATANKALLARCAELRDYTSLGSSVPGELLATIALEHWGAILEQHLAVARRNRALFVREIATADWLDGLPGNVGSGQGASVHHMALMLADALGNRILPERRDEFRPGEMRHLTSDIRRIAAVGYAPSVDLASGIEQYLAWIRRQGDVRDYFAAAEHTRERRIVQ